MLKPSLISIGLLLPFLAACSKEEAAPADPSAGITRTPATASSTSQPEAKRGGSATAESSAAKTTSGVAAADEDEQAILKAVPTEEEAAASAAKEINADNVEQALAEIRKELGGGQ